MATLPQVDLSQLTVPQKLELIERIWDSIPDAKSPIQLASWQEELIDSRIKEADENPDSSVPWDEAMGRLRSRYQ